MMISLRALENLSAKYLHHRVTAKIFANLPYAPPSRPAHSSAERNVRLTFREVQAVLERIEGILERTEADELDHAAKGVEVLNALLHCACLCADLLDLNGLEDGASCSALEENVRGRARHDGLDDGSKKG